MLMIISGYLRFFALLEHVAVKRLMESFRREKSAVLLALGKFAQELKDVLGRDFSDLFRGLPSGHMRRKGGTHFAGYAAVGEVGGFFHPLTVEIEEYLNGFPALARQTSMPVGISRSFPLKGMKPLINGNLTGIQIPLSSGLRVDVFIWTMNDITHEYDYLS
jgi:hypothetical protein